MDIEQERQRIITTYGPWTAHNIRLAEGLYTIGERVVGDEIKLRRVVQIVADSARKPFSEMRILDLACLEGLYAVEFARQGATVVGIEGREANIEKARFAQRALGLGNVTFVEDDVRNLSEEKYGLFDVALCLGILYHLDRPDVFRFLEKIAAVCQGILVIDTHISLQPVVSSLYRGRRYWGRIHAEHHPSATPGERLKQLWSSLDTPNSFWLTRASLFSFLKQVGFTSAHECWVPVEARKPAGRITVLAVKGQPRQVLSAPLLGTHTDGEIRERAEWASPLFRLYYGLVNQARRVAKRVVQDRRWR